MYLYHLDRGGTIQPGASITLFGGEFLPAGLQNSEFVYQLGGQLSRHAIRYLDPVCKPQPYFNCGDRIFFSADSVFYQLSVADHRILEYGFELVRKAHFPHFPSRFQCLFALGSIDDFAQWPELTGSSENRIFEIKAPDDTPRFDSAWLRGGMCQGITHDGYHVAYAPTLCFDQAYNYWSGVPSESPRWEYLIPLPIEGCNIRGPFRLQQTGQEDQLL